MFVCSNLAGADKYHSDLMGVIRRHLVQNLYSAVNHLPQSIHTVNNTVQTRYSRLIAGQRGKRTCVLGSSRGLLASFPKKGE